MAAPDEHAALAQALARLHASIDASELHGALSGYLCAGGRADAAYWLDHPEITPGVDAATADPAMRNRFERARAQFASDPAQVELLLPPPNAPLKQRARALVEWCRGFLGGFGLGAGAASAHLSAEGEEILGDLGAISATRAESGDDEEASFNDVLAFVQTAVALLHRHVQAARRAAARSVH